MSFNWCSKNSYWRFSDARQHLAQFQTPLIFSCLVGLLSRSHTRYLGAKRMGQAGLDSSRWHDVIFLLSRFCLAISFVFRDVSHCNSFLFLVCIHIHMWIYIQPNVFLLSISLPVVSYAYIFFFARGGGGRGVTLANRMSKLAWMIRWNTTHRAGGHGRKIGFWLVGDDGDELAQRLYWRMICAPCTRITGRNSTARRSSKISRRVRGLGSYRRLHISSINPFNSWTFFNTRGKGWNDPELSLLSRPLNLLRVILEPRM